MSVVDDHPRCPCGCGIFVVGDDWYEQHFDAEHRCKLCGVAVVSSKIGRVTLRDGTETGCPLCAYYIAMSQVRRHAEMLVAARDTSPASSEERR